MNEQDIRSKILEIFKLERENHLVSFEESNFMDYLSNPAYQKNTLKNSFKGARKYYRFMDKLELEFGICFSLQDLDKYYSLDKLTAKVFEKINKEKSNKAILSQRNKEKSKFILEIVLIIILIALFYFFGINLISIIASILFGVIIYWTLSSKIYNKKQLKKMNKRIFKNV